jgi:hypothetical protein
VRPFDWLSRYRRVDLVDVPGEDDLRARARPGDDRLHLMGGEVLGLVHDEERVLFPLPWFRRF